VQFAVRRFLVEEARRRVFFRAKVRLGINLSRDVDTVFFLIVSHDAAVL
jgi:hypothetical protein